MSWVKQSDTQWRDVRFTALTDGAQALWHRANSYSADNLTDGVIEDEALKHLKTRKRYVDELVEAGYWVRRPIGGWLAAGWQEFIRSKVDVLAKRSEQKQRDSRKSPRQSAKVLPPPGPNSNSQISSEEREELKTPHVISSDTARVRERAPLPEPPPELSPAEPKLSPEGRVWQLYTVALGLEAMMLPPNHHGALQRIAQAAKAEASGQSEGERFDRAVERLLRAWLSDPWVQQHEPPISHLGNKIEKYARAKVVKLKPVAKSIHPADQFDEWERQLERERREDEERARATAAE